MNNELIAVIFAAILTGILLTYLKIRLSKKNSFWFFTKSLDDGELIGLCLDLPRSGPKREFLLRALLMEAVASRKSPEDLPFGILTRKDIFNMTCSKEIVRLFAQRIIWSIKKGVLPETNDLNAIFATYHDIHFSRLEEDLRDEIVWSLAKVLAEKVKDYGTWKIFFKSKGVPWIQLIRWVLDRPEIQPMKEELPVKDLLAFCQLSDLAEQNVAASGSKPDAKKSFPHGRGVGVSFG